MMPLSLTVRPRSPVPVSKSAWKLAPETTWAPRQLSPKAIDRIGCGHDLGELALEAGKGCLVHRFGIEAAAGMRGGGIGDEPGLEAEVAGRSGCRRAAVVGREPGDDDLLGPVGA